MTAHNKKQYEGGYYFIPQPLIRAGIHAHTTALTNPMSPATLSALNTIQRTPWRINTWLMSVMREAFVSGSNLGDLPYVDNLQVPRKTDEEWEAMGEIEKGEWKKDLSDTHGINARMEGRRHSFIHKLDIANELKDRPAIWFPHFLDFRGRFYPMCQDLHPQGDDIGKALLMFADAKPLTDRGLFWLAVRLANTFGEDKLPLAGRVAWVKANHAAILDSGADPLDGARFWADAEEPWQFLATCREWHEAHLLADPSTYASRLSVQLDGSCNGLQHLSAMGRDPVGAKATNLDANVVRQDIYVQVAEVVIRMVSEDAAAGNPQAHEWVGRITRKTVKRAVMTTPYGVTARGISDQLVADGHTAGMEKRGAAASYLRSQIVRALDETVVAAKSVMAWIQAVASTLSKNGIPFRFTTPTGNVIQQSYYNLNQVRVQTLLGLLTLWEEDAVGGLNDRKQVLASAPNLVHAFDASHEAATVNRLTTEYSDVLSFSMIHDSYGTHACDTDAMARVLREEFVAIYQENWLEKIEQEVRAYAPDANIPSYTEFVQLGDFDISNVLKSEFFFA